MHYKKFYGNRGNGSYSVVMVCELYIWLCRGENLHRSPFPLIHSFSEREILMHNIATDLVENFFQNRKKM